MSGLVHRRRGLEHRASDSSRSEHSDPTEGLSGLEVLSIDRIYCLCRVPMRALSRKFALTVSLSQVSHQLFGVVAGCCPERMPHVSQDPCC